MDFNSVYNRLSPQIQVNDQMLELQSKKNQILYYTLKPFLSLFFKFNKDPYKWSCPQVYLLILQLIQFGLLEIGIYINSQAIRNTIEMNNPQYSLRKVDFGNGKTFYVDLNQNHRNNLSQPLQHSNLYQHFLPHPPPTPPNLIQSANYQLSPSDAHYLNIGQGEGVSSKQLQASRSLEYAQTHTQFKGTKNKRSNKSLEVHSPFAQSSKKNRIFESRNNGCNGTKRSNTNLQNIETHFQILNQNDKQIVNQQEKTTKPSINLCFSRVNQLKNTDRLPSYQKKLSNDIGFNQPAKQMVTNSQPLSRHQAYVTSESKRWSVSPNERLNFISQIESKHFIAMQESKTSLAPMVKFESNRNCNQLQASYNCKQSKNVTRQMHQSKRNIQCFCEQSTLKAGNEKQKGNTKSNHEISISNIEQDNSFSRYFDNEDELLPLLNRISYKNVEIQNKSYQKSDEIVTHNIFMDFEKAPNSPLLNRRQSKHVVHYDCTFNQGSDATTDIKLRPIQTASIKRLMLGLINKIPLFLIILTVSLLIIQIVR